MTMQPTHNNHQEFNINNPDLEQTESTYSNFIDIIRSETNCSDSDIVYQEALAVINSLKNNRTPKLDFSSVISKHINPSHQEKIQKAYHNVILRPLTEHLNPENYWDILKDPEVCEKLLALVTLVDILPLAIALSYVAPSERAQYIKNHTQWSFAAITNANIIPKEKQKEMAERIISNGKNFREIGTMVVSLGKLESIKKQDYWSLAEQIMKKERAGKTYLYASKIPGLSAQELQIMSDHYISSGNPEMVHHFIDHLDPAKLGDHISTFIDQCISLGNNTSFTLLHHSQKLSPHMSEQQREAIVDQVLKSDELPEIIPELKHLDIPETKHSEIFDALQKNKFVRKSMLARAALSLKGIGNDKLFEAISNYVRILIDSDYCNLEELLNYFNETQQQEIAKRMITKGCTAELFDNRQYFNKIKPNTAKTFIDIAIKQNPNNIEEVFDYFDNFTEIDPDETFELAKLFAKHYTRSRKTLIRSLNEKLPSLTHEQWKEIIQILEDRGSYGVQAIFHHFSFVSQKISVEIGEYTRKLLIKGDARSAVTLAMEIIKDPNNPLYTSFLKQMEKEMPFTFPDILKEKNTLIREANLNYALAFYNEWEAGNSKPDEQKDYELLLQDLLNLPSPQLKFYISPLLIVKNVKLPTEEINTKPISEYFKGTEGFKTLTKEQRTMLNRLINAKTPEKRKQILKKAEKNKLTSLNKAKTPEEKERILKKTKDLPEDLLKELDLRLRIASLKKYLHIILENALKDAAPEALMSLAKNSRIYRDSQVQISFITLIQNLTKSTIKKETLNLLFSPWEKELKNNLSGFKDFLNKINATLSLEQFIGEVGQESKLSDIEYKDKTIKDLSREVDIINKKTVMEQLEIKEETTDSKKYFETLGNKKIFRNSTTIVSYLASLTKTTTTAHYIEKALSALKLFAQSVYNGTWNELRQKPEHAPVYNSIKNSHKTFAESWSKSKVFNVNEFIDSSETEKKDIDPKQFLEEKLVNFQHFNDTAKLQKILPWLKGETEQPLKGDNKLETALIEFAKADSNQTKLSALDEAILWLTNNEPKSELINDINTLKTRLKLSNQMSIEGCTVEFTKNPFDFLAQGTEIQGSCQRVNGSANLNSGLATRLISEDSGLMVVKDPQGKMVGRIVVRLMQDDNGNPVIFVEKSYINPGYEWAETALEKAISTMGNEHWKIPVISERSGDPFAGKATYPGNGYPDYVDCESRGIVDEAYSLSNLCYFPGTKTR